MFIFSLHTYNEVVSGVFIRSIIRCDGHVDPGETGLIPVVDAGLSVCEALQVPQAPPEVLGVLVEGRHHQLFSGNV